MPTKIEYKREGKKIVKVVTKEVSEGGMNSKITRLKNQVANANSQIGAWTRTRDTLAKQLESLEKVKDDKAFVFR